MKQFKNHLDYIEYFKTLSLNYSPESFLNSTATLLSTLQPDIESHRTSCPGFVTDLSEIQALLPRINFLNYNEMLNLGCRVAILEHYVQERQDLIKGLGAIAIGKSLSFNPENGATYNALADLERQNRTKHLPKHELKKLYRLSIKKGVPEELEREITSLLENSASLN